MISQIRPSVTYSRPVEAFEVPLRGDPDEQREIQSQRAALVYVLVGALLWLAGWQLLSLVGAP